MDEQNLNSVIEEKVRAAVAIRNADLLKNIRNMITQIIAPVAAPSRQPEAPVFKRKSNEEQYMLIFIKQYGALHILLEGLAYRTE